MRIANVGKSVGLVGLLLTSLMIGLVTVPTASAVNETSNGEILTTETWSGTHTLTGDVTVAEGAKLIIQAGTTINIPAGVYIDVEGAICAGSASCGATQGSSSSTIRFEWALPADTTVAGRCYQQGNQLLTNTDAKMWFWCYHSKHHQSSIDRNVARLLQQCVRTSNLCSNTASSSVWYTCL